MAYKCNRLRVLGAKIETTAGTAEAITASEATVPVFNLTYTENTTYTRRENVSGGKLKGRRGPLIAQMSFDVEAMGLGSSGDPAWATTFLPPCGFVGSTGVYTYTRVYANQKTLTLKSFIDGQYRLIHGAAGAVRLTYNAGGISYFNFTFTGIANAVAETSNIAPTLITTQPLLGATIFTYHNGSGAVTLTGPSGVIDWGCVVQPIEDPSTDGFRQFCVSDFNPIMTCEPYGEAMSVIDFDGDWTANAERAVQLKMGSGTGGTAIDINATKATHSSAPRWGERGRLVTRGLNLDFNDDLAPTISFL